MNADGGCPHYVTKGGGGSTRRDPDMSPDMTRIVFESQTSLAYTIYTMKVDGTNQQPLMIPRVEGDFEPSWQPIPFAPSTGTARGRMAGIH